MDLSKVYSPLNFQLEIISGLREKLFFVTKSLLKMTVHSSDTSLKVFGKHKKYKRYASNSFSNYVLWNILRQRFKKVHKYLLNSLRSMSSTKRWFSVSIFILKRFLVLFTKCELTLRVDMIEAKKIRCVWTYLRSIHP